MVHLQADISLCEPIQGMPFGDDIPDRFVVSFDSSLFIWSGRVAVKDTGPLTAVKVVFQGHGVGKLRAVVRRQHGYKLFKAVGAKLQIQPVYDINHRLRVIIVS